jgi:hypothetical protein
VDGPLHATIEEFATEGFTHVECYCPRCRMIRLSFYLPLRGRHSLILAAPLLCNHPRSTRLGFVHHVPRTPHAVRTSLPWRKRGQSSLLSTKPILSEINFDEPFYAVPEALNLRAA